MRSFFRRSTLLIIILAILPISLVSSLLDRVTKDIQDRSYNQALKKIGSSSNNDFLLFLKGNVLLEQGKYKTAEKTYRQLLRNFPNSQWIYKTHFRRAEALTKLKRFSEAAIIYASALKRLGKQQRRVKMAKRYQNLGNKAITPLKKDATIARSRYRKAASYFKKALELGKLPSKLDSRIHLSQAVTLFKAGRYSEKQTARRILEKLEKKGTIKHPELKPETIFYLAGCYASLYRGWEARSRYYQLLRTGKGIKYPTKAGIALLKIYRFNKAVYNNRRYQNGTAIVSIMKKRFPKHKLTRQARAWKAKALLSLGKSEKAIETIKLFLQDYPDKEESADLAFSLGEKLLTTGQPQKALHQFQKYLSSYPASRHWQTVQKRIVDISYKKGRTLYGLKKYKQAAEAWTKFQKRYPLDNRVPLAARLKGEALNRLKKYEQALLIWKELASKYPGTTDGNKALISAATLLADKLHRFPEAFKLLKKVTGWRRRKLAKAIKAEITKPSLTLKTEKIFTSHEKASIKFKVRNAKEIKVRIYDLNLNAYFRKTHSISQMEKLDIDLIKPDKEFSYKIKDYKKYRLYSKNISLNNLGPGSYLIHCRTKTLKATTLLIRSDLGLLVKSSKRQLFVMTSNLKNGKPISGVNLLFSNGKEIFLTGKTGSKGLFTKTYNKKRKSYDLAVFAWRGRHAASNAPGFTRNLQKVETKTISHVSTDRPAYRPGDLVRFRYTIRNSYNGALSIPKGKFIVTFKGPSGLTLFSKKTTLSKFGTYSGSFKLDQALEIGHGEFRLLNGKEKLLTTQSLPILHYRPKQTETQIITDKPAYFPGEKIKATLRFTRLFGAPASRDYFYMKINKEQWKRYRADSKGEKKITLDAARYAQQGSFTIYVRPSWALKVSNKTIRLLERDFSIKASSVRKTYISNERVKIAVKINALKGSSKKRKLKYTITHTKIVPGSTNLRSKFKTGSITTKKNGNRIIRFTPSNPGLYTILISGKSLTGELVESSTTITVPDKKSKQKLYLLHEQNKLKEGQPFLLPVYAYTSSKYALLTVERERVLYSRLVKISKGKTKISLPIKAKFFPNCRISLTITTRDGLYTTGANFKVEKKIKMKIKGLPSHKIGPGTKVSFTLQSLDQVGRNNESEIFIAVIDDSLFSATGKTLRNIETVFQTPISFNKMKTISFAPFSYSAKTIGRNMALLKALKNTEKEKRKYEYSKSSLKKMSRRGGRRIAKPAQRLDDGISKISPIADKKDRFSRDASPKVKTRRQAEMILAGLAFYKARLKTDSQGKIKINFTLPPKSARWRVVAFAAGKKGEVGSLQKTFSSGYDTHIRLQVPQTMLRGDSIKAKALLYNTSEERKSGRISFSIKDKRGTKLINQNYNLAKGEMKEFSFSLKPTHSSPIHITATAGNTIIKETIEVIEPGTMVTAGNGGIATRTSRLYIDCTMQPGAKKGNLKIDITRPLDSIFSGYSGQSFGGNSLTGQINKLLRLTGRYKYLKRQASWTRYRRESLQIQITDIMVHLRILQKNYWGGTSPDTALLAYAYYAISSAKKLGIDTRGFVYLFKDLENTLNSKFKQSNHVSTKAIILFALSWNKKAGFAYLNRLYRMRTSLNNREHALLTTALANMKRRSMASICANEITERLRTTDDMAWLPGEFTKRIDWFSSATDQTALATMGLLKAAPKSKQIPKMIKWLLSRRTRFGWRVSTANGLIPAILSEYLKSQEDSSGYAAYVIVNGKRFGKTNSKGRLTLTIPQKLLKNGKNNIVINLSGKGQYLYSLTHSQKLDGFVPGAGSFPGKVKVNNDYPIFQIEDTQFKRGYSILKGRYKRVRNELTKVSIGTAFTVRTHLDLKSGSTRRFLVEQTLPPGCRLLSRTTDKRVEHFEQSGNKLRFWVRRFYNSSDIYFNYTIVAELPGTVVIPPCIVSPLNRPDSRWNGKAKTISFLPEGSSYREKYRFSPNEKYALGLYWHKKGKLDKAWKLLSYCLNNYKLKSSPYKKIVKSLLNIAIKKRKMRAIVRFFEILKERDPDMSIPLEDAAIVSSAYTSIGEHERAYQIMAGILEARFLQESALSGGYQDEKRIKDSVSFMEQLFLQYPDQSTQRITYYSLAHQLYSRASEAKDSELKKLKISRKYLFAKSEFLFGRYMLLFPSDARSPEAAFSILSLLVEQEKYQAVISNSKRYTRVHKKSAYLDAYQYLAAYSLFFQEKFKQAAKFCTKVSTEKFPTKTGDISPSRYKHIAVHMLGKIYHSLQQFQKALSAYKRIESRFPDATRAISFLKQKHLSIPEVTTLGTSGAAKLKIDFKGVRKVTMTLYKVDFLLLYLKEKDLSKITKINLAGIKPYLTRKVTLSKTHPYLGRSKTLSIPAKGKGAYLVVLKANGIETSGMILRSDIRMDVLGLSTKGIARVSVRNIKTGKVVPGSVINFLSSGSKEIKTVTTDLRGMAETGGLKGIPSIVGVRKGHYCFFRGNTPFRTSRWSSGKYDSSDYKKKALKKLFQQRSIIQRSNEMIWNKNIKQKKEGLMLKKAF